MCTHLNRLRRCNAFGFLIVSSVGWSMEPAMLQAQKTQYAHREIAIPAATADEPRIKEFSVDKALQYLEHGAAAWTGTSNCVSCHTNGTYLITRPFLSAQLGRPDKSIRDFFVSQLGEFEQQDPKQLQNGITPTQIAYLAGGLAEWDKHVDGQLSAETTKALELLSKVQSADGSFGNARCWPPLESSSFHGATVAAMAMATAPGYLDSFDQPPSCYTSVVKFLKQTVPPHDYGRLLLLWASTRIDHLVSDDQKAELVTTILNHQQVDGGWSIRKFAEPESWGSGNRAAKLRGEPDFERPASDGHQTGLVITVLLDAGVTVDDPRIKRGIDWLKNNQRESGRWWTRSLNTDRSHYITYSATAYALMALVKANATRKP